MNEMPIKNTYEEVASENLEPTEEDLKELEEKMPDLLYELSEKDFSSKAYRKFFENNMSQYILEASKFKLLTHEEEIELSKRILEGDEIAKEKLINANLLLVINIAKRINRFGKYDENDLVQEGNLGLLKAANMFDYTKGYRFSTYAFWWIRQYINRGIMDTMHTIRIPVHQSEKISRITKAEREFLAQNSYAPTVAELSKITGFSESTIILLKNTLDPISLSTHIKTEEEDSSELGMFIADSSVNIEEDYEGKFLEWNLPLELIRILKNPKTIFVITKRFGLDGGDPLTLEAIGEQLGLSRERIRQIEANAIKKIRRNPRFKKMFENLV